MPEEKLQPQQGRRSGYDSYTGIWGNPYYEQEFAEITNRVFGYMVFRKGLALVERMARDGWVHSTPYDGKPYDETWKLVPDEWDHEHCWVCQYSIGDGDGDGCWVNRENQFLCDACYGHYIHDSGPGADQALSGQDA